MASELSGPELIVEHDGGGLVRCPACKSVLFVNLHLLSGEDIGRCSSCGAAWGIDNGLVMALEERLNGG